jgi:hypothetical protein
VRSEPRTVGVSPAQEASLRAEPNRVMSPTSARMTGAVNVPELPQRRRRDPRLRQQVRAQQLRQDRGIDLVVLQPRGGDRLALQRVHQVRVEAVVLEQLQQPARSSEPIAGVRRDVSQRSRGIACRSARRAWLICVQTPRMPGTSWPIRWDRSRWGCVSPPSRSRGAVPQAVRRNPRIWQRAARSIVCDQDSVADGVGTR